MGRLVVNLITFVGIVGDYSTHLRRTGSYHCMARIDICRYFSIERVIN